MKNKSPKLRLSYFFRQRKRIYGKDLSENMPDLVKPESNGTDSINEDILRWADDGGQMLPVYAGLRNGKANDSCRKVTMAVNSKWLNKA